jgi:predicted ATPase
VILERFGPRGLYLLDEPEAALSVRGCLALIRRMHVRGDGAGRAHGSFLEDPGRLLRYLLADDD